MIEAFVLSKGNNIVIESATSFPQATISESSDNDQSVPNTATIDLGYLPNIARQDPSLNMTDDENKVIHSLSHFSATDL